MFSKALELTLNLAFTRAREKRHEFMTVEHLLLALIDNPEAAEVLIACGADLERLRAGLNIFIEETTPRIPADRDLDTQPTLGFQRVLQRAIFQVQSAGRSEVDGANVLAAIFGEQESQAVYFLSQENVTRLDIMNYIAHGISRSQGPGDIQGQIESSIDPEAQVQAEQAAQESALQRYAVNLNERARAGKIDPLIGRKKHD